MERIGSAIWRKSSFSGSNGGNCIEVGQVPGIVAVRDTKDSGTGPALKFTPASWTAFTDRIRREG